MGQNLSSADVYVSLNGEDPFCVTALYKAGSPVRQDGSMVKWVVSLSCIDLQTSFQRWKGGMYFSPSLNFMRIFCLLRLLHLLRFIAVLLEAGS